MQAILPEIPSEPRANPARQRYRASLILLALLALATIQHAQAQERRTGDASPKQLMRSTGTLSVELGGTGGLYSVHYDRRFRDHWAWRGGVGLVATVTPAVVSGDEPFPSLLIGAPIGVRWLPGDGDWRLEAGLSVAPGLGAEGAAEPAIWGGPSVGVCHQPTGGGLFFRATLTATTIATLDDARIGPGIGLGVGYAF
jgi:hypothetical protein